MKTRSATGISFYPLPPKHQVAPTTTFLLAEGGSSVGKNVHIVKTPISDRSHVRFLFCFVSLPFSSLFAKNLNIPLENFWVLWLSPDYSDHSFGQLLASAICNLSFLI